MDERKEANLEKEFATDLAEKAIEKKGKWQRAFGSATPDREV